MRTVLKRLLAALVAALLAAACLTPLTLAEDWRDQLRESFGLSEDYSIESDADAKDDDAPFTDPQQIVNYLARYGHLPDNFLTKKEAKVRGWDSSKNYVGEVAPGMSIGGDRFGNYEGLLPDAKGRTWYECDANYKGKKRGAERVLFSSDGLYYYTNDHYQTFTQMFPEDAP